MTRKSAWLGWMATAAAAAVLAAGSAAKAAEPGPPPAQEQQREEATDTGEVWRCERERLEALSRERDRQEQRMVLDQLVRARKESSDPAEQSRLERRIGLRSLSEFIAAQTWSQAVADVRICLRQKAIARALREAGIAIEGLEEERRRPGERTGGPVRKRQAPIERES